MEDNNNNSHSSQDYFIEHYIDMLIQEAEKLYNKLVKEITNGIIYDPLLAAVYPSSRHCYRPSSDGTTTKSSSVPPKSTARY